MTNAWNGRFIGVAALAVIVVGTVIIWHGAAHPTVQAVAADQHPSSGDRMVAAPGLVEPIGEEHQIGSQVIGIIQEMRVEENDKVAANQIIAVIENSEQRAQLASAQANLALRRAQLEEAINGARPEERNEAKAALAQADAALDLARSQYSRELPLANSGTSPQSALDLASSNLHAAEAAEEEGTAKLALIMAGTRAEEIAAARAQVQLAEAGVAEAQAMLDKTYIRSPISGTILRRYLVAGEAVTNVPPTLIAIVGDLSALRVRAEVDETDVGHVKVGQRVEMTADAYPGRKFEGTVMRVSQRLGAKQVETGRPAERIDTKVLQVLIDLDAGATLPIGLRVDAYFQMGSGT